jgi:DNA-binding Xre family transcriptional regulator
LRSKYSREKVSILIPFLWVLAYDTRIMEQTHRLIETLKKILKARGITYKELAKNLKLSEANLKRAFSKQTFTLKRIEAICRILEIDFYELAKQSKGHVQDVSDTLTVEQERALAQESALFTYFYLLLSGMTVKQIEEKYDFQGKGQQLFLKLDRLKLIEAHPDNRVKLLVATNVRWLPQGALNEKYEVALKKEFLSGSFTGKNEKLRFLSGYFSESALKIMAVKTERLLGEFLDLAETEARLGAGKGVRQWLLLAYRPWGFSIASKYERKK